MSRKYDCLAKQASDKLNSMAAYGQSKHKDKEKNNHKPMMDKIYSYRTMRNYKEVASRFAHWMQKTHPQKKTLESARKFVPEYLQSRIDTNKSAWTVRQEAAALAKLYQVPTTALGVALPSRHRGDVTQFASTTVSKWQPSKHQDVVDLCRATGLRRSEMAALKPSDVTIDAQGRCNVHVHKGKGGRSRDVTALNMRPYEIAQAAIAKKQTNVIARFPHNAQIHAMRREFARELYAKLARPVNGLSHQEKYFCRADMRGVVFDRQAMVVVSNQLGHGKPDKDRLDVVTNYLKTR